MVAPADALRDPCSGRPATRLPALRSVRCTPRASVVDGSVVGDRRPRSHRFSQLPHCDRLAGAGLFRNVFHLRKALYKFDTCAPLHGRREDHLGFSEYLKNGAQEPCVVLGPCEHSAQRAVQSVNRVSTSIYLFFAGLCRGGVAVAVVNVTMHTSDTVLLGNSAATTTLRLSAAPLPAQAV